MKVIRGIIRIEDVPAIPEVMNQEALNCNQIRNQNRELKRLSAAVCLHLLKLHSAKENQNYTEPSSTL